MKRFMYIAGVLLVAMAVLFVSCNNEAAHTTLNDDGTVDLKMVIHVEGEEKALGYSEHYAAGFEITSYEYIAVCTTKPGAQGTQSTWKTLTVNEGSATLEKMGRGSWTISVRAKNANGGVISLGSTSVALRANGQNVAVYLNNVNGETAATVTIGVTVPVLENGAVEVKFTELSDIDNLSSGTSVTMTKHEGYSTSFAGTGIDVTTAAEGQDGYTGSVSLDPGLYVMQILYKDDGAAVSGQTMAFRVADNTPFAINGTLTVTDLLDLILTPIAADDRLIDVQMEEAEFLSGTLNCAATATVSSGLLTSTSYHWYLDGHLVSGQTTSSFSKSGYESLKGMHVLTCIASGRLGGQDVLGYSSCEFSADPVMKNVGGTVFYIDDSADGTYVFMNGEGEIVDAPEVGTDCSDWTYTAIGATKDKYYVTDLTDTTYLNRSWAHDEEYHVVWAAVGTFQLEDLTDYNDEIDVIGLVGENINDPDNPWDSTGTCTYEIENPESTIGNGRRNTAFILENRSDEGEYFPKTVGQTREFDYSELEYEDAISVWECALEANEAEVNGCDDWYVPSIGELMMLVDGETSQTWKTKTNDRTWSSSAYGDEEVWDHNWTDGTLHSYSWVIDTWYASPECSYEYGYRTGIGDDYDRYWYGDEVYGDVVPDSDDPYSCVLIRSF